jgi:hypothetical protein
VPSYDEGNLETVLENHPRSRYAGSLDVSVVTKAPKIRLGPREAAIEPAHVDTRLRLDIGLI